MHPHKSICCLYFLYYKLFLSICGGYYCCIQFIRCYSYNYLCYCESFYSFIKYIFCCNVVMNIIGYVIQIIMKIIIIKTYESKYK